jgi:hypothetical protein
MNEVIVIFCLAATGCLVRLSTDRCLQSLARRVPNGTIATGPFHRQPSESPPRAAPVVTVGLALTTYAAIALFLVTELPGQFALHRAMLAFALLCVGGLIGEIARTGTGTRATDGESDDQPQREITPTSVALSVALMIALNLVVAVLVSGQGLLQIIPQQVNVQDQPAELEQIVVVARRGADDNALGSSFL